MSAFEFIAVDLEGRQSRGHLPATSAEQARRELRLRQLIPIEVKPIATTRQAALGSSKATFSARTRVEVIRQLAAVISAGLPVEQAFAIVADQAAPKTAAALLSVRASIAEGARLPQALEAAPGLFPPVLRAAIAAGDATGQLGVVLDRLSHQLERSHQLHQKMRSAAIYPVIVTLFSVVLIAALMIVIVPKLVAQFDTFGAELPALTRAVVAVSDFLRDSGWAIAGLALIAWLCGRWLANFSSVAQSMDRALLGLPVIGRMRSAGQGALFSRVLAVLLSSGTPMVDALKAAKATAPSKSMQADVETIATQVSQGTPIGTAFKQARTFPTLLTQMIASGEAGRNLPLMLERAADYLESDFETRASTLIALIEPAIILVLGSVIAVVVLAIMLPIIQINTYALN